MKRSILTFLVAGTVFYFCFFLLPTTKIQAATVTPVTSMQREYTLIEPIPCLDKINCVDGNATKVSFERYLNLLFLVMFSLAAIFTVFMIVLGGFEYMTTDAVSDKEEGKTRIWNAVSGLLMTLVSYAILYTIDPHLVQIKSNLIPQLTNVKYQSLDALAQMNDLLLRTAELKNARNRAASTTELAADYRKLAGQAAPGSDEQKTLLLKANQLDQESIQIRVDANVQAEIDKARKNIQQAELDSHLGGLISATNFTSEETTDYKQNITNIERTYCGEVQSDDPRDEGLEPQKRRKVTIIDPECKKGAISEMKDPAQAQYYRSKEKYEVSTLENEFETTERLKVLQSAKNTESAQKALIVAKQMEDALTTKANAIKDAKLKAQYIAETTAKIKQLREAVPTGTKIEPTKQSTFGSPGENYVGS